VLASRRDGPLAGGALGRGGHPRHGQPSFLDGLFGASDFFARASGFGSGFDSDFVSVFDSGFDSGFESDSPPAFPGGDFRL
jgi:hypothetical protein